MKGKEFFISIAIIAILILSTGASGEWNREKRLTYSGTASNQSVVPDTESNLHIFYQENYGGHVIIRYTKLDPAGNTLIPPRIICSTSGDDLLPSALVMGDEIHLLYYGETGGGYRLYHALLDLNGTRLAQDSVLTDITSERPVEAPEMIADSHGDISVVWSQKGLPLQNITGKGRYRSQVYVMKLKRDGSILMPPLELSTGYGNGIYPDVVIDGQDRTVVTWSEDITGNYEIYYAVVREGQGRDNVERIRLTDTPGESVMGRLLLFRGEVYLTWSDGGRDNNLYTIHLGIIRGSALVQNERISGNGNAFNPSIATDGNRIYIAWQDDRNTLEGSSGRDAMKSAEDNISGGKSYFERHLLGEEGFDVSGANNWEIYLSVLDGAGVLLENNSRVTDMPRASIEPVIRIDEKGTERLVWRDMAFSSGDLFYRDDFSYNSGEKGVEIAEGGGSLAIAGGIGVLLLIYLFSGEGRRYLLLKFFAVPLYSTISRDRLMENKNRREIVSLINSNHGITFSNLMKEVGLKNGALAYHLYTLEKEHYIKSVKDGKYRRFYPRGTPVTGLSSLQERIVSIIMANPSITQREIANIIDSTPQTVNYNIKKLIKAGVVFLKKDGKHTRCYLTERSRAI